MSEKTYAERIFSFATQLQSTINNLQDFYDLKNGQIVLKSDPFDLHQWIEHIIYFFAPQASAKELSIAYIIDAQVVELMGGQIGVESNTGAGSTFYFTVTL